MVIHWNHSSTEFAKKYSLPREILVLRNGFETSAKNKLPIVRVIVVVLMVTEVTDGKHLSVSDTRAKYSIHTIAQ